MSGNLRTTPEYQLQVSTPSDLSDQPLADIIFALPAPLTRFIGQFSASGEHVHERDQARHFIRFVGGMWF